MDAVTKREVRHSFFGGFLGGVIGYAVGALVGSAWLSYALFFVCGYMGYNVRQVWSVAREVVPAAFRWCRYAIGVVNPHPILSFPVFLLAWPMMWSSVNTAVGDTGITEFIQHWPVYFAANLEWVRSGVNPLDESCIRCFGGSFSGRLLISTLLAVCMGVFATFFWSAFGWCIRGIEEFVPWSIRAEWRIFTHLPQAFAWCVKCARVTATFLYACLIRAPRAIGIAFFFLTVGTVVCVVKAVVLVVVGIHSVRRLTCGMATLGGGALYLALAPFHVAGVPIALTALGCGMVCGCGAAGIAFLLDGSELRERCVLFLKQDTTRTLAPAWIR
ncbi:MAG: hypothetical protein V1723_03110 [Candidatus Uhrbacteria bacterium]